MNICCAQSVNHPSVGVVSLVCNQDFGPDAANQNVRAVQVAGLSGCQVEACRITQRITNRMDFGAQPAFGSPDAFGFFDDPLAPAEC